MFNPPISTFVHLKANLGGKSSQSTTQKATAVQEALTLIDKQVKIIETDHMNSNFEGAYQMQVAMGDMQQAVAGWPQIMQDVHQAAQAVIEEGQKIAALPDGIPYVEVIKAEVEQELGVIVQLSSNFKAAKKRFETFENNVSQAYSKSVNANANAKNAIQQKELAIQNTLAMLKAQKKSLTSAGSIVEGILTFGVTVQMKLDKITAESAKLNAQDVSLAEDEIAYALALGHFSNALHATKLAVYAMSTVDNSIEQAVNSITGIMSSTSSNPTVMQALFKAFKKEYAGAVSDAERLK